MNIEEDLSVSRLTMAQRLEIWRESKSYLSPNAKSNGQKKEKKLPHDETKKQLVSTISSHANILTSQMKQSNQSMEKHRDMPAKSKVSASKYNQFRNPRDSLQFETYKNTSNTEINGQNSVYLEQNQNPNVFSPNLSFSATFPPNSRYKTEKSYENKYDNEVHFHRAEFPLPAGPKELDDDISKDTHIAVQNFTPEKVYPKRSRVSNGVLSPTNGYGIPSVCVANRNASQEIRDTNVQPYLTIEQLHEMQLFMEKYIALKEAYKTIEEQLQQKNNLFEELSNQISMSKEEVATMHFLNAIQEQKILELENFISSNHIKNHESAANKHRKHKTEIVKLQKEKLEYEERANAMIQQMTQQMSDLQDMAMTRIEVLEKELMESRRKCEKLEEEKQGRLTPRSLSPVRFDTKNAMEISPKPSTQTQSLPNKFAINEDSFDYFSGLESSPVQNRIRNRVGTSRRMSTMFPLSSSPVSPERSKSRRKNSYQELDEDIESGSEDTETRSEEDDDDLNGINSGDDSPRDMQAAECQL